MQSLIDGFSMTAVIQRDHISYIVGNNLAELIEESCKYITRHRDWYKEQIETDLLKNGRSVVSRFSNCLTGGIVILYDKNGIVNIDHLKQLPSNEVYQLYPKINNN